MDPINGDHNFVFINSDNAVEEDKILLSYATRIDLWMTPGGGREEDESERECVVRELIEETGYIIEPLNVALEMTEYYEEERRFPY